MGSKLISAGCSFTDHEYFRWAYKEEKPKDHIFWDELLPPTPLPTRLPTPLPTPLPSPLSALVSNCMSISSMGCALKKICAG